MGIARVGVGEDWVGVGVGDGVGIGCARIGVVEVGGPGCWMNLSRGVGLGW